MVGRVTLPADRPAPRPDGGTGYPGVALRPDAAGTADGLAQEPYTREGRRIEALFTVTENHVGIAARTGFGGDHQPLTAEQRRAVLAKRICAEQFADSVGTGFYGIDIHHHAGGTPGLSLQVFPYQIPLGALIPVAGAMASTGTADLIARVLLDSVAQGHAVVGLALILVVTMFLSDLINNAATAAVMCPIAIGTAEVLGVNADSFLMAVAIGASCAFLTPIGHQNNTLILGPGGFHFGDYWRLGLPLEVLVIAVSMPMLLWVWPL